MASAPPPTRAAGAPRYCCAAPHPPPLAAQPPTSLPSPRPLPTAPPVRPPAPWCPTVSNNIEGGSSVSEALKAPCALLLPDHVRPRTHACRCHSGRDHRHIHLQLHHSQRVEGAARGCARAMVLPRGVPILSACPAAAWLRTCPSCRHPAFHAGRHDVLLL